MTVKKYAITVRGLVEPVELGITLPHEHVLKKKFIGRYLPAPDEAEVSSDQPNIEDIWRFKRYPAGYTVHRQPMSIEDTIWELDFFMKAGGRTIVDMSSEGISQDGPGILEISRRNGMHIILGTGYYIDELQPDWTHRASDHDLTRYLVDNILTGDEHGLRHGAIGEIGVEGPTELEKRCVAAAARAQKRTGAPVAIHCMSGILPSFRPSTDEIVQIYVKEGGDLKQLTLSHQDGSGDDVDYQERMLRMGITLAYDTFGAEGVFAYKKRYIQLPQDQQRIEEIAALVRRGWASQLLLSNDIGSNNVFKRSWGGWGWGHIFDTLMPRFAAAGVDDVAIDTMVRKNPARMLGFAER